MILNLCTMGGESEGHLSWYTAYCVVHLRIARKTACWTTCEERWVIAVFAQLERPRLCRGTGKNLDVCDFHRLLHLLKHANSSLQLIVGLRRGVAAVGVVMSCC